MKKWEYHRVFFSTPEQLNTLGLSGWEMVYCKGDMPVFKRELVGVVTESPVISPEEMAQRKAMERGMSKEMLRNYLKEQV